MLNLHRRPALLHRATASSIAIALALGLSSCAESKVAQCNRLAEMVNRTETFMQEFETEMQNFSTNASQVENLEDIKTAATQYTDAVNNVVANLDGLATDLESTEVTDETLMQFRNQYVEIIRGFSTALKEASTAMGGVKTVQSEAELPDRIEASQQQMMAAVQSIQDLSQRETEIIDGVNQYCGATPPAESSPAPAEAPPANTTPAPAPAN